RLTATRPASRGDRSTASADGPQNQASDLADPGPAQLKSRGCRPVHGGAPDVPDRQVRVSRPPRKFQSRAGMLTATKTCRQLRGISRLWGVRSWLLSV